MRDTIILIILGSRSDHVIICYTSQTTLVIPKYLKCSQLLLKIYHFNLIPANSIIRSHVLYMSQVSYILSNCLFAILVWSCSAPLTIWRVNSLTSLHRCIYFPSLDMTKHLILWSVGGLINSEM